MAGPNGNGSKPDMGVKGATGLNRDRASAVGGILPDYNLQDVLGVTGLKRFGDQSRIYEEWLPELMGDNAQKAWREMYEQDPVIGATWFAIEMLMRQVDWSDRPADDSPKAAEIAEFFTQARHDMEGSFGDALSEIMSMGPYGWALLEKCYKLRRGMEQTDPTLKSKYEDGLYAWRKWEIRSQDTRYRWVFDPETSDVIAMEQLAPPDYKLRRLPMAKCMLFRTKARKGNPEGVSVLRHAFRPWMFVKRIQNHEGVGIERDLAGLPVADVPAEWMSPSATPEQQAALAAVRKVVTGIKRDEDEGVVWPRAYDTNGNLLTELRLLSTGGSRQFDTNAIIGRYEQRMAMTVLADFIFLGHEGVGSFALAGNKTAMFTLAIGTWLDNIARVIMESGYTEVMKLNKWPAELTPTLERGDIESVDLTQLADFIQKLASSGAPVWPNDELLTWVMEQAHMPVPEHGQADDEVEEGTIKHGPMYSSPIEALTAAIVAQQEEAKAAAAAKAAPPAVAPPGTKPGVEPGAQEAAAEAAKVAAKA